MGVLLFCLLTPALVHLLRTRLLAWRRAGCPTGRTGIRWGRDPSCAPPAPAPPPVGFRVLAADFDALLGEALRGLPEDAHTGAWRAGCPGLPTEAETAAAGFALTEAARAQALAVRLNKLLDSFPTTVEEDERLLTQNLNSRRRAAVGYRLERKRLVRVARDALLMYSSVVSPGP